MTVQFVHFVLKIPAVKSLLYAAMLPKDYLDAHTHADELEGRYLRYWPSGYTEVYSHNMQHSKTKQD